MPKRKRLLASQNCCSCYPKTFIFSFSSWGEFEISFRASASLCSFSSLIRNLIAYADFLTMAAIALTSSIGLILPKVHRRIAGTPTAIGACFVLWLLSFVIISPIVFGYELLGYNFGRFGWSAGGGRCNVMHLESEERSRFRGDGAYVYGMAIPCVVIFIRCCNL